MRYDVTNEQIAHEYTTNRRSIRQVAALVNMDYASVRARLVKAGVRLRRRGDYDRGRLKRMSEELLKKLSAHGWNLIGERTTPNGLTVYKFGRQPETGMGGALRRYAEEDERSADGWQWWIEQEG